MLDIVIIIIIAGFGLVGYYKGVVKTIITLLSSVVSLVLAFLMYPIVSMLLKFTPIYTFINQWISKMIAGIEFGNRLQTQGKVITNNLTWLPKFIGEQIVKNNNEEVYKILHVTTINDYVSAYLTNIVMGMLSILVTWLILKILMALFLRTADAVASNVPVVSNVNRVGGGIIGIGKGLLAVWGIYLLVPVLITQPAFADLNGYIASSYLAKWLYENNLILIAFNAYFKL